MAAYTITATEVTPGSASTGMAPTILYGIAGAAITAGQAIYLDETTNTLKLAQCDGTAAEAECVGVALNSSAIGQPVGYVAQGDIYLDTAALTNATKGEVTTLTATAGGLGPNEDNATTNYVSIVGVMVTSNPGLLRVSINNTGITHV